MTLAFALLSVHIPCPRGTTHRQQGACTLERGQAMQDTRTVHKAKGEQRIPRGIRIPRYLWDFADSHSLTMGDGNASRLIERLLRETRDAVRRAA